jgi:CubicO group peptidase (beta-lactamase class C family)
VDLDPGTKLRYSGGGCTVMQQLMIDVTGEAFKQFMEKTVLAPLKMTDSTFVQPLPAEKVPAAATGYYASDKAVEGKWHIYLMRQ